MSSCQAGGPAGSPTVLGRLTTSLFLILPAFSTHRAHGSGSGVGAVTGTGGPGSELELWGFAGFRAGGGATRAEL